MSLSLTTAIELWPGVQISEFDSSTRDKTYRVERNDGRHFQINEKLYHLLDCLRTPLSLAALGSEYQQRTGQAVATEQLQQIGAQLVEQGIVIESGQTPPPVKTTAQEPSAYLGLHYRRDLFAAETLAPFARMLQSCFRRPIAAVLLILIAGAHVLTYAHLGLPPHLDMDAVSWPLLYTILLASILIHELGHLAACQRWQCPHGPLGVGLYFFNPVFYVDVTAAWRLNRRQRAIVDVGGGYLQLLCAPVCWVLFWMTQETTYLMAIVIIDLLILGNFEPLMKLDGYWLLSDLTGVPNLHTRTGEAVKRMWLWWLWRLGRRAAAPPASPFSQWSPWVRIVIGGYVGLSMLLWPLLMVAMIPMLAEAVSSYPALWKTALAALLEALRTGDMMLVLAQLKVLFLPTLALANLGFLLKMTIERSCKARAANKTQDE
jgi:putative peptide zinc metalloprotease protein